MRYSAAVRLWRGFAPVLAHWWQMLERAPFGVTGNRNTGLPSLQVEQQTLPCRSVGSSDTHARHCCARPVAVSGKVSHAADTPHVTHSQIRPRGGRGRDPRAGAISAAALGGAVGFGAAEVGDLEVNLPLDVRFGFVFGCEFGVGAGGSCAGEGTVGSDVEAGGVVGETACGADPAVWLFLLLRLRLSARLRVGLAVAVEVLVRGFFRAGLCLVGAPFLVPDVAVMDGTVCGHGV